MNIVYAANNQYTKLLSVSMFSLFDNNQNAKEITVYVLTDGISAENKTRIENIGDAFKRKVFFVDTQSALDEMRQRGVRGYANAVDKGMTAYARLRIGSFLPDEDRALYLDCDTVISGSLEELYDTDIGNCTVAMALDCVNNKYKEVVSIDSNKYYYNSGVMLIDLKKWRERRCYERIEAHLLHVRNNYPLVDQDFLNVVLGDECYILNMSYNYLSSWFLYDWGGNVHVFDRNENSFYKKENYICGYEAKEKAVIFHFAGNAYIRPWYKNSVHPMKSYYDKYWAECGYKTQNQNHYKWQLGYLIQYILYRFFPRNIQVMLGKVMQDIFMRKLYGV